MNRLTRLTALLLAMLMVFSTAASAETAYQAGEMTVEDWQGIVDSAEEKLFTVDEGDSGKTVTPPPVVTPAPGAYYPYSDGTTTELVIKTEGVSDVTRQMTASGVAVLRNADAGKWQMQIDGTWINITGATGTELWVTSAMMNGMTTADFRKALEPVDEKTGEYTIFTQTATIEIVAEVSGAMFLMAREGEVETTPTPTPVVAANGIMTLAEANEDLVKYLVTIEYRFLKNNAIAANSWYAQVGNKNPVLNRTVAYPVVVGYKLATTVKAFDAAGNEIVLPADQFVHSTANKNMTINAQINSDITIIVFYEPDQVPYTVKYYQEKLSYAAGAQTEDRYDEIESDRIIQSGLTESTIAEDIAADGYVATDANGVQFYAPQDKYTGFLPLLYDDGQAIAAAGDTEVKVRYQRLYYLLSFKLNGGTGFDPVYDKYGAETGLQTRSDPTRPGYTFAGWATAPDQTTKLLQNADLPATVPAANQIYYAVWTPATTTYSVVHWFETLDSTASTPKYYAAHVVTGVAGNTEATVYSNQQTKLVNLANYNEIASGMTEKPIHFEHKPLLEGDKDYAVQLTGDGKSVVNVYYTRNTYTVRFYYAASTTNNQGRINAVYVITDQRYNDDAWTFSDKTWANANKTVLPNIQARYEALDEAYETTGYGGNLGSIKPAGSTYTYHYYDVTAKYMADIATYWPDFLLDYSDDGDRDDSLYGNRILNSWCMHPGTPQWAERQGVAGANITYKGNYGSMDDGLYATGYEDDEYLGTDENGNKIITYYTAYWRSQSDYWKYHIWLELLPGMTVPTDPETNQPKRTETKSYKNDAGQTITKTYYLEEFVYATSGSGVSSQSAPGYTGFTDQPKLKYLDGTYRKDSAHDIEDAFELHFYYERNEYPLTYVYPTSSGGNFDGCAGPVWQEYVGIWCFHAACSG